MISTHDRIRSHRCLHFQVSFKFVPSSEELECCDRGVVTDLLEVDGTALDECLKGLSEDGVEWFFQGEVEYGEGDGEEEGVVESSDGVGILGCSFEEEGCVGEGGGESLEVGAVVEDGDGEGDVEDGLASDEVGADFLEDEGEDLLLEGELLAVDELEHSLAFVGDPLVLEEEVVALLVPLLQGVVVPRPDVQVVAAQCFGPVQTQLHLLELLFHALLLQLLHAGLLLLLLLLLLFLLFLLFLRCISVVEQVLDELGNDNFHPGVLQLPEVVREGRELLEVMDGHADVLLLRQVPAIPERGVAYQDPFINHRCYTPPYDAAPLRSRLLHQIHPPTLQVHVPHHLKPPAPVQHTHLPHLPPHQRSALVQHQADLLTLDRLVPAHLLLVVRQRMEHQLLALHLREHQARPQVVGVLLMLQYTALSLVVEQVEVGVVMEIVGGELVLERLQEVRQLVLGLFAGGEVVVLELVLLVLELEPIALALLGWLLGRLVGVEFLAALLEVGVPLADEVRVGGADEDLLELALVRPDLEQLETALVLLLADPLEDVVGEVDLVRLRAVLLLPDPQPALQLVQLDLPLVPEDRAHDVQLAQEDALRHQAVHDVQVQVRLGFPGQHRQLVQLVLVQQLVALPLGGLLRVVQAVLQEPQLLLHLRRHLAAPLLVSNPYLPSALTLQEARQLQEALLQSLVHVYSYIMSEQELAAQSIHSYLGALAKKRTQRDISNLLQALGNKLNAIQQLSDKHQYTFLLHFFAKAQLKVLQKGELVYYMDQNSDKYYLQLTGQTLIYTYTPKEGFEYTDEKSKKQKGKNFINQDFLDLDFIQQFYQVTQETAYIGDLLGDIEKPSSNQVAITQANSAFAFYTREDYKNYEMSMVQMENREKYRYLSQHPIFKTLSNDLLIKIASLMKTQTYVQKQLVYREDDLAEFVYFIKKGEFKMFKKIQEKNENGEYLFIQHQKYKKIEIASLQEWETFGLEDAQQKRIYQVICVSQRGLVYAASIKQLQNMVNQAKGQNEELQKLFHNQTYSLKQQIHQERENNLKKIMNQDEEKCKSERSQSRGRTFNQMQKNKRNSSVNNEDANEWLIKKQLGKTLNNTQLEINDAFQYQSEPPTCKTIRCHKVKLSEGELTDIDQFERKIESKRTVLQRHTNNYSFDRKCISFKFEKWDSSS